MSSITERNGCFHVVIINAVRTKYEESSRKAVEEIVTGLQTTKFLDTFMMMIISYILACFRVHIFFILSSLAQKAFATFHMKLSVVSEIIRGESGQEFEYCCIRFLRRVA
jgi:hypothetical protein